jgi:pilus assembly protein CpaB
MNARKMVLLIVALLIGGGTVFLAHSTLTPSAVPVTATESAVKVEEPSASQVLVAAVDLPAGTLIKETDVKWQVWPQDGLTDAYAEKGKKEVKDYVGSVVRQGLRVGEPILAGRVVRIDEQGFLAAVLSPGMRAITIPITPASGVAGFAFPGDRVDVIVTQKITRAGPNNMGTIEHKVSETMLTDVRVLALDQKTNDQTKEAKVAQLATLEVTPRQAERLALVDELGTLSLVLRSIGTPTSGADTKADANPTGYTLDSDVSHALPRPANRNGQVQRVQILRGKESSETIFDAQ